MEIRRHRVRFFVEIIINYNVTIHVNIIIIEANRYGESYNMYVK